MAMTEKEFKSYLALYGAAIENWPNDVQAEAIQAAHQSNFRGLLIEQRYCEDMLRTNDVIPPASPWLADRIINAAGKRASGASIVAWLEEVLASVLPQPGFALATVLTLGIVIGFGLPMMNKEGNIQPVYLDDAAL